MDMTYGTQIDREFSVGSAPALEVHTVEGAVHVQAGGDGTIRVEAELEHEECGLGFERSGDTVRIDAGPGEAPGEASLTVTVPHGCSVAVHTVQADIDVSEVGGPVDLHSVQGDITVSGANGAAAPLAVQSVEGDVVVSRSTGRLVLGTVGGELRIDAVSGVLDLQTTNGDVVVERSELQRFHVNSKNGDLRIESPLTPREHSFARTVNGDVLLLVPEDSGFTLQMKTVNGDLRCDLPHETINGSKRNRQIRVGGGGATIELETTNGDVAVEASGASARHEHAAANASTEWHPAPPIPPMPPIPPAANLDPAPGPFEPIGPLEPGATEVTGAGTTIGILARLESGELTVDEAMAQLYEAR